MGGGERARSAAARVRPSYVRMAQLCAWPSYVAGPSMCACVRAKRAPCGEKVWKRCRGVSRECRGSVEGVQRECRGSAEGRRDLSVH